MRLSNLKFLLKIILDLSIIIYSSVFIYRIIFGSFKFQLWFLKVSVTDYLRLVNILLILLVVRLILFDKPNWYISLTRRYDFFKILMICSFNYLFVVFFVKLFVVLSTFLKFKRHISLLDSIISFSFDIFICIMIVLLCYLLLKLPKLINIKVIESSYKVILSIFFPILSLAFFIASIFYLLSGYVYFEWGSFLNYHHYDAAIKADVTNVFIDYIVSFKTIFIFIFLIASSILAKIAYDYFSINNHKLPILILSLLSFCVLSVFQNFSSKPYDPAVYSPFILAFVEKANTDGIPEYLIKDINISNFTYQSGSYSKNEDLDLFKGFAKGFNVIFIVLDSARKNNVSVYKYKRETTPTIDFLSQKGLVFHNAYITQPRTVKTLGSLVLGVYPDPRKRSLVWEPMRIKGKDNFLSRVIKNNYDIYYGTNAIDFGKDGVSNFLDVASNNKISRKVEWEMLKKKYNYRESFEDGTLLVKDFLQWSQTNINKYVAILWFNNAHMPYISQLKKFGENSAIDKYDNCIYDMDTYLSILVQGLTKQSKLKHTLLIIMSDHGEAAGDKLETGRGHSLYDFSVRIPFIIYNEKIPHCIDLYNRFQPQDIPSTILYMIGLPYHLNQSEVIFNKSSQEKIYFSTIYQDYKLGMQDKNIKFTYVPKYDYVSFYDTNKDPQENENIVQQFSRKEIEKFKNDALRWYKYQISYLNKLFPPIE